MGWIQIETHANGPADSDFHSSSFVGFSPFSILKMLDKGQEDLPSRMSSSLLIMEGSSHTRQKNCL